MRELSVTIFPRPREQTSNFDRDSNGHKKAPHLAWKAPFWGIDVHVRGSNGSKPSKGVRGRKSAVMCSLHGP